VTGQIVKSRKKTISVLIKLTIIAISWTFVINKLFKSSDISDFTSCFSNISFQNFQLLFLIIILMIINWSLETIKWQYLISGVQKISFFTAFKAVWTGVTAGTATPNRIGEFGGRILFLKSENRKKAVTLTLFGDLSQMIITLVFGIAGLFLLSNYYFQGNSIFDNNILLICFASILIALCLSIYFLINFILAKLLKIKIISKYIIKYIPDSEINLTNKSVSLLYSFLRYMVFCFQFYLALRFFNIEIGLIQSFVAISTMYLAIHTIPTYFFIEIGVRLSFAIIFIGLFTDKTIAISFASTLIYLINIVIPVLFGSIFIFKNRK